ncbi:MAG: TIGR04002 family protein [Firmicutes bacterium HGW-Firmicutes-21]|nr:MAG: TIGR04002 family protein [Firmicutes bacterium HGW-Firmicutes-21]
MNRNKNIKRLTVAAMGAALVFIFTRFFQMPIVNGTGYIHPGDSMIYLFTTLLPMPYGIFVGAIGASLADITSGWAVYAPFTIIIKALMAVWFTSRKNVFSVRNISALIIATIVLVAGYFLAEVFIYGKELAAPNAIFTLIQGLVNATLFITLSIILSKVKAYNTLKEELM